MHCGNNQGPGDLITAAGTKGMDRTKSPASFRLCNKNTPVTLTPWTSASEVSSHVLNLTLPTPLHNKGESELALIMD